MAETMAWDDFSDHVTTQAVGARFWRAPKARNIIVQLVRDIVALDDPYTVRQACLAMESMDLSPLVPRISRPLLMTNGTHDSSRRSPRSREVRPPTSAGSSPPSR